MTENESKKYGKQNDIEKGITENLVVVHFQFVGPQSQTKKQDQSRNDKRAHPNELIEKPMRNFSAQFAQPVLGNNIVIGKYLSHRTSREALVYLPSQAIGNKWKEEEYSSNEKKQAKYLRDARVLQIEIELKFWGSSFLLPTSRRFFLSIGHNWGYDLRTVPNKSKPIDNRKQSKKAGLVYTFRFKCGKIA